MRSPAKDNKSSNDILSLGFLSASSSEAGWLPQPNVCVFQSYLYNEMLRYCLYSYPPHILLPSDLSITTHFFLLAQNPTPRFLHTWYLFVNSPILNIYTPQITLIWVCQVFTARTLVQCLSVRPLN